jgi:N-methylhydantoinase A
LSKVQVAAGIHTILNNRMADEIGLLTIARGLDPRDFALLVLGGAGPMHGGPLARMLKIPRVIIPFAPGVLSALGLLVSDIEHDHALSFRQRASLVSVGELRRAFAKLDKMGEDDMRRDQIATERVGTRRYAEMRYVGQSYELEIEVDTIDNGAVDQLVRQFHETHERIYLQKNQSTDVEFVNLRTVHFVFVPKPRLTPPVPGPSWQAAQKGTRAAYFEEIGGYTDIPVFTRERLPIGEHRAGPFIIEQLDSTTVVFPGERSYVEPKGNVIVEMPRHG